MVAEELCIRESIHVYVLQGLCTVALGHGKCLSMIRHSQCDGSHAESRPDHTGTRRYEFLLAVLPSLAVTCSHSSQWHGNGRLPRLAFLVRNGSRLRHSPFRDNLNVSSCSHHAQLSRPRTQSLSAMMLLPCAIGPKWIATDPQTALSLVATYWWDFFVYSTPS